MNMAHYKQLLGDNDVHNFKCKNVYDLQEKQPYHSMA